MSQRKTRPSDHESGRIRHVSKTVLALATIVFGLLQIPMGMATIMSPMAFDAGETVAAWVMVGSVSSFIPLCLVSIPTSWIMYRRKSYRIAIAISFVPLVNILILTTIWFFPLYGHP